MNVKLWIVGVMIAVVVVIAACEKKSAEGSPKGSSTPTAAKADATGRCAHEIKQEKCPFCNPGLVESEGFCGEHGVAEALCVQCRPYLKAAFRAKGDWCKEHEMPESQCVQCNPDLKEKMKPGEHGSKPPATAGTPEAGQCEHGITQAKCPFCTPALIESDGFCKEHNVAEALCVKCRPYLEAAFKAKGDWCNEHGTPESQCVECNPDLKNKPKGQG
jgi:cobalt-zinc-cadmium efflux system membrane fusion protein